MRFAFRGEVNETVPNTLATLLDHLEVVGTEVVDDKVASDHSAVLVELQIRSEP